MHNPIVSICCICHNHEPFIRQCLEGFIMQKTNFPIEIIIHDDASTDKTADIIREFELKYPDIIRPIYQKINQYSLEKGRVSKIVYTATRGKYIALCEGDDYWTDPLKLQKQVDFLEANPEYVMSTHDVDIIWEGVKEIKNFYPKPIQDATFEILLYYGVFYHTNTMLFKNINFGNIDWSYKLPGGQGLISLLVTYHGKNFHFFEKMAVKRKNPNGITQDKSRLKWLKKNKISLQIYLLENLKVHFNGTKNDVLEIKIKELKKKQNTQKIKRIFYYPYFFLKQLFGKIC